LIATENGGPSYVLYTGTSRHNGTFDLVGSELTRVFQVMSLVWSPSMVLLRGLYETWLFLTKIYVVLPNTANYDMHLV
jgi:hypothetical protein